MTQMTSVFTVALTTEFDPAQTAKACDIVRAAVQRALAEAELPDMATLEVDLLEDTHTEVEEGDEIDPQEGP